METQLHKKKITNAKKLSLLFILFCFINISPTKALLNAYSFSPSTATLDPMTTGVTSIISANQDNIASAVTNIGFTFTLNSTAYTQFSVNSNGLMRLGSTAVSTTATNTLAANSDFPKITAYWDDLRTTASGGSVRYRLSGSAPNRILIVDWICTTITGTIPVKFQVWLYETSNSIQFVYGTCGANTSSYSVGMAASTTANDVAYVSVNSTFNSSTMSNTVVNNANSASIVANNSYKFALPPGCAGSLSPAASATNISLTPTLSWAAGTGTTKGYDVYFGTAASPPRVSYNQAGTTYTPATLTANTVYFWKIVARNDSAQAASCSTIQFTTVVAPGCANITAPTAAATNVSMTPTLSWTAGSGTTTGYDVYFSTNSALVTASDVSVRVATNQAGLSYLPGSLIAATVYYWKIVPQNNGAYTSGCATNQFTTVVAPGCAANLFPAASATGISPSAQLSWTVGTGTTTGYDVYFGTAASPPIVATNQVGLSYNPGALTPGTVYFWKVQPRNGGAIASCSVIQFTVAVAPGCAVSLVPAASATNISLTPTITWAPSGTTTGYDVYFGTAASPPLVSTNQVGAAYTPATLSINTVYFWKVVPNNNGSQASGCSTQQFTTIAAPGCAGSLSPAASATNVLLNAQLTWAAGSGTTTGYDVYFGTAASPPIVSTNQAGTTYNPGALVAGTIYFWKINPRNGAAIASCSTNQFTTVAAPGCAGSISPTAAAINVAPTATLSWTAGSGTTTGYDVYFGTAASPPLVSTNQVGLTYNPGTLAIGTTYFWKIVPQNSGVLATGCATNQFTTVVAPGCAATISPLANATSVSLSAQLSWTAGSGTTNGYDVYFGTVASPPIVSTNQAGLTYNPGALTAGTVYFWKVVPRNGAALATGCATNQFTAAVAPACVTNISPAAAATNISTTPTLSWSPSGSTTGYDVYFGTAANPPLVVTNQASATYTPATLTVGTTYFWKIVPQNNGALATGCVINQFTTVVAPGCAGSLFPAASATGITPTPTLTWTPGSGTTTGYDVYFGTAASPPIVSTNQVGTSYTPSTLTNGTVYFWKVQPRNGAAIATCTTNQFTTAVAPGCTGTPFPAASATNVALNAVLTWVAGSGTTTGYDVYFGTAASPPLVSPNQVGLSYNPGALTAGTVYFWKVIPKNNGAAPTSCTTIQFTTAVAPGCSGTPSPAANATNVSVTPTLSWVVGSGTTNGYDVYFGTSPTPPIVSTAQVGTSYVPGTLSVSTTYYWKVVPRNGTALASGCVTNQFTTVAPPGCVIDLMPDSADQDVPISGQSITWNPGSGITTGYDVYFGTAANPPLVSSNQAGTSYILPALTIATTYYIKVIARNGTLTSSGCYITPFTTIAPPGCVSSWYPLDLTTGVTPIGLTLSWSPDGGTTTGYDVYFGTSSNPPIVVTDQVGTTYSPPTLSNATVYYWKIVPRNFSALSVGCSIFQFTTAVAPGCVTSISPSAFATNISMTPTISWSPGSGNTTTYDVYFGTAASPPLVSSNQSATSYTPATLNAASTYFWKVIPQNNGAYNNSCSVNQFTTVVAPGCATALSPAASVTNVNPTTALLSWAPGTGITTGYDVYFGTAASPPIVSTNQAGTTYNPGTLLAGTVYFWKVVPRNGGALASCSTIQFTTSTAPGCVANSSPAAGASNVATTVVLSWTAGTGTTTGYDVYFGTVPSPPLVSSNQPGLNYNPGTISASTTYYWKVVPINNGASPTSCTTNSFSTLLGTSCAANISPAGGTLNLPISTTLSWTSGLGNAPTGYDVYFGTTSNPPLVVTNQVATTYNPGFLLWNTQYFWKVIPRTGAVLATGCQVNTFSTRTALSYDVTRSTNVAFTSISATGTSVPSWRNGSNTDDNLSNAIPMNFNFVYNGNTYSSFLVSTNGFITLNTSTPATGGDPISPYTYDNTLLSSGAVPTSPLTIAPFWSDITCQGQASNLQINLDNCIKYRTTGSVGSRVLTVEWIAMETFFTTGPNFNFQLKLYEGSNDIDIIYGTMEGFNGTFNNVNLKYSVGLNGLTLSSTPQVGEYTNQLITDSRNFDAIPSGALFVIPECNSKLHFTVGNYTPYVPVSNVPVNDEPAAAIHLNVNNTPCIDLCGTYYSGAHATLSSYPSCSGTPDDDVWFEFSATNPTTTIKVLGGASYDPTIELFSSAMVSLQCSNTVGLGLAETLNATGLVIGQQYFVRVYHRTSLWGNSGIGAATSSGQFSICISGVPVPPSNDECATNISLPITSVLTLGTSTYAGSASTGIAACSVAGTTPDDDVWYSFVAIKAIEIITVVGNNGFNAVVQLFSGNCGALTPLACVNNFGNGQTEVLNASGLTIGATYYVRVYHSGIGGGSGSYSISVSSPAPPCTNLMLPTDSTWDMPASGVTVTWQSVPGADNYILLFDTINPPLQQVVMTSDTSWDSPSLLGGKTYYWRVVPGNGSSYTSNCHVGYFIVQPTPYALNVKVFLQEFYIGTNLMRTALNPGDTVTDTIAIYLMDEFNSLLYWYIIPVSIHGNATAYFPINAIESDYYLAITHRNSLQVWSKNLFTFNGDTTIDLTVSDTTTYGNNQKQVAPGVYAMYYGDMNQDGFVDATDFDLVSSSASSFTTGAYLNEDLNGDHIIESSDLTLMENVLWLNLHLQTPFIP